jgi:preprotein translocase subunit SecE
MARNRQRAKQRQAERRARRQADEGSRPAPAREEPAREEPVVDEPVVDDPTTVEPSPAVPPELAAGAPPQDEGFSERLIQEDSVLGDRPVYDEPPLSEDEAYEEIEDWELEDPEEAIAAGGAGEAGYEVRGRRGREAGEAHKDRPRVIQFLVAVWAELQRVQWPNRQAVVTLTGVVLGFVLIAGGYLGLLDAIFSELIKSIL